MEVEVWGGGRDARRPRIVHGSLHGNDTAAWRPSSPLSSAAQPIDPLRETGKGGGSERVWGGGVCASKAGHSRRMRSATSVRVEVEVEVEYEYDVARGRGVLPLRSLRWPRRRAA